MIDLTPLEVRQKKDDFRRSFRGYDVELVNDFLDLVADRMEELVSQNMRLTDRAEALDRELADYRRKETALSDALMTAQRLQEDARAHAHRESELLIREARLEAESVRQDADRALAREEQTLRQVRARRAELVGSFRRLLERELSELAVVEETLELTGEVEQLRLLGTGEDEDAEDEGMEGSGPIVEGELEVEPEPEPHPGPTHDEFDAPISEEEWETAWADGPAAGGAAGAEEPGEAVSHDRHDDAAPSRGMDDAEEDDWLSSLRERRERD